MKALRFYSGRSVHDERQADVFDAVMALLDISGIAYGRRDEERMDDFAGAMVRHPSSRGTSVGELAVLVIDAFQMGLLADRWEVEMSPPVLRRMTVLEAFSDAGTAYDTDAPTKRLERTPSPEVPSKRALKQGIRKGRQATPATASNVVDMASYRVLYADGTADPITADEVPTVLADVTARRPAPQPRF